MFWNVMIALQDAGEWNPIPDKGHLDPDKDTTPIPFRVRSHKEENPVDTPEIQGEEE